MKKVLPIIALLSVASVATPLVAPLSASATKKEEVVYINLDPNGAGKGIDVVNSFSLKEAGKITDYGKYSEVKNMTTSDKIEKDDEKIVIEAKNDGKIYYDGKLANNESPWNVEIKYYLDGQEISGKDLAGKSGDLKIRLKVTKNDNYDGPDFYKNYALQSSIEFDTKKVENIEAKKATFANVGQKKRLTYIALPNKGADYTITAKVKDFETDGFSINGLALNLDVDVDTAPLTSKVGELTSAIVKLDDGATKLDDGAAKLEDGAAQAKTGALKLASGASEFGNGLRTINNNSASLKNGSAAFYQGLKTLQSRLASLDFSEAAAKLAAATSYANYKSTIEAGIAAQTGMQIPLETFIAQDTTGTATALLSATQNYFNGLSAQVPQTLTSELSAKLAELKSGVDALVANYEKLNSGTSAYVDGVSTLSSKYSALESGAQSLSGGANSLSSGASSLKSGADTLASGTHTLREKTSGLTEMVTQKIDDLLADLKGNAHIGSFTSDKNEEVESVQFVIKTAKIAKKK